MSQTELLLKEVAGLSPDYMAQVFDFINQLKHKAPPGGKSRRTDGFQSLAAGVEQRFR